MAAPSNGAKESSKEKKVVARFFSGVGKRHGAIDYGVEVWLEGRGKMKEGEGETEGEIDRGEGR